MAKDCTAVATACDREMHDSAMNRLSPHTLVVSMNPQNTSRRAEV